MKAEEKRGPGSLFQKIWTPTRSSRVKTGKFCSMLIGNSFTRAPRRAFEILAGRGLPVRCPERTFGVADHFVPNRQSKMSILIEPERRLMIELFDRNTRAAGIAAFGMNDSRQGIVHVIGPEQGLTQPGMDHRVRRQPHIDPRRAGCACIRHRRV